ncbi:MAG: Smr/MutS family protein, partial [Spirochaetes bacterium]|nr:Smr/MutS family protein [Candidatus Ornithospirochaeta stercoripullorum]
SKLRTMMPQSTLDLHGYTVAEAESCVKSFLDECRENGLRKISIITGKGLHSEDGIGVLRDAVIHVLDESGIVSEKYSAPQSAGGSGALWIILKA